MTKVTNEPEEPEVLYMNDKSQKGYHVKIAKDKDRKMTFDSYGSFVTFVTFCLKSRTKGAVYILK